MNQVGRARSRPELDFRTTKLATSSGKVEALIWRALLRQLKSDGPSPRRARLGEATPDEGDAERQAFMTKPSQRAASERRANAR
jgi:hypothetical protein